MPAPRGKKRKSNQSTESADELNAPMTTQKVATKNEEDASRESPRKRRKVGITIAQKQALIDNLQLEITERARKLRAHYNLHAQTLRTRIELRVNRIPLALRKVKMGDLMMKHSGEQQDKPSAATAMSRRPPVPQKDVFSGYSNIHRVPIHNGPHASPSRPLKRLRLVPFPAASPRLTLTCQISEDVLGDKENETEKIDNPKKRLRGGAAIRGNPGQVLSPTTSNARVAPKGRAGASPSKSLIARPVSPTKTGSSSNILSNMVEKARSTRAAATARKTTTSSTASSSNGAAPPATRTRRGAATTATTAASRAAAASRAGRRASGTSEASDGSTATVVKRRTAAASKAAPAAAPAARRTVMSTIKRGVTGGTTRKAPAAKTAAAAPATGTGRVLRKRN